ncbi:MAG: Cell division protein FtsQ [Candidatus Berkelbacteria bacterium]|nr:Cell division protein FtsQ [Candidatus Berkelbacteria bacterium]
MNKSNQISRSPKIFTDLNPSNPEQNREPKKWPKFIKAFIIFVIVLGALIYIVNYSGIFNIKKVIFEGGQLDKINNILGQNILFINIGLINDDIKNKYPNTSNVKIIRGLPSTVKITTENYQPKIVWQTQNTMYLVSQLGYIYSETQSANDLPIVKDNKDLPVNINDQVVSINFIEFIYNLSLKFNEVLGFKIVNYEVEDTVFQVNAQTDKGWFIKFDSTRSVDNQIAAIKELMKNHEKDIREYVDVRVEGKVFYK